MKLEEKDQLDFFFEFARSSILGLKSEIAISRSENNKMQKEKQSMEKTLKEVVFKAQAREKDIIEKVGITLYQSVLLLNEKKAKIKSLREQVTNSVTMMRENQATQYESTLFSI